MHRAGSARANGAARRVVVVVAASVCLGWVLAPAASATTVTIGALDVSGAQGNVNCFNAACSRTFAQLSQPTPGTLLSAPADGVLTGWQVHADTGGVGSLALRVLRRDPDGVRFAGVATSPQVTASAMDGSPFHPVSIPVRAGEYIGVDIVQAADPFDRVDVYFTEPAGATAGIWTDGLPDGSLAAPSDTASGIRLMLNAVESLRPAVSGVSPASGSTAGGQAVTISGSDLDGATGVSFGGAPAASFTASATQITAMAPAGPPGVVDVRVTGPGGVSPATAADAYAYVGSSGGASPQGGATVAAVRTEALSPSAFRAAPRGPSALASKRSYGTRVTYMLDQVANVRFTVVQRRAGRKAGDGRCVTRAKANRRAGKCTRLVPVRGSFVRAGISGVNRFRFTGRLAGRTLKPGSYRLVATPRSGGKAGHSAHAAFRIIQ